MSEKTYDLVVIGSGPAGYVAAIRAAQLGFDTALIEKEETLGGTCLNVGCIPSKALLNSSELFDEAQKNFSRHGITASNLAINVAAMVKRKNDIVKQITGGVAFLMKKNKIEIIKGTGKIERLGVVSATSTEGVKTVQAKRILIATGSVPVILPGIEFDGNRVGTSTEALNYPEVPKHLVVIGAGVIGLELGSVWRRLGAKVTVVEYADRALPGMDREISAEAAKSFMKMGIDFIFGAKVTSAKAAGDEAEVKYQDTSGAIQSIQCDRVLVAVGRRPYADGLGAREIGIEINKRNQIVIDKNYQTNIPGIYAIGDCVPGPMLAHKGSEEGVAAVEFMATGHCHLNYDAIPNIVYTAPEIASVGKSEEELKDAGIAYKKGSFPFVALGRAKAIGHGEGFVKILADAKTDRILGAHIIGHHAGDLIAEVAIAMELSASAEDIGRATHAHPTMAEAIKEAALAVAGRALHSA